jgi:phosphoserine phosphatase RsbU/P
MIDSAKRGLQMFNRWSITWRLGVLVLVGVGLVLAGLTGYSYFSAKTMLEEELMGKAAAIAMTVTSRIELSTRSVEGMAENLAVQIETVPLSEEQAYILLERLMVRNRDVFGSAVAMAPSGSGEHVTVPYVYRESSGLKKTDLAAGNYHYEAWDWYIIPKEREKPVWSEPYFDDGGGNIPMATYSVPVFNQKTKMFLGVVTGDMALDSLSRLLESLQLGPSNYAFILSAQGRVIAHPATALVLKESIFGVAATRGDAELHDLGHRMVDGQSGYIAYTSVVNGKPGWIVYRPIASTGWSLGIFFSQEELMARVVELNRSQWYLGIIGFLLLFAVVMSIARSITQPIRQLEQATRRLSEGEFDTVIPDIPGRDEVANLARSFSVMINELRVYMDVLQETTATKERIESELRIAQSIQMGLVPKTFPAFPERSEFQLFAVLEPAREVGGDFYDFFFLDKENETLCLVVGDVSDKGMGAALFMAVTRTLLRFLAKETQEPAAILSRLNDELSANNESCMFVTLFCAAFHLPSGQCSYASGGHCPPMVVHPDGKLTRLTDAKGPVVGGMEGMTYTSGSYRLARGDVLFLYTDGVTEAANRKQDLFGEMRMNQELVQLKDSSPEELLQSLRGSLKEFAQGAQQSDDITMLAFRYHGTR